MPRPSSVDKLPEEIRSQIAELRARGWEIDQIREKLAELLDQVPSRSALGRHIFKIDKMGAAIRESRAIAEGIARTMGDAPESQLARLNIELLHGTILKMFVRAQDGEENAIDQDGRAMLAGSPEEIMLLAKGLQHLATASKTNEEFYAKVLARGIEEGKRQASVAVETVGRERGITASTIDAIKASIFGVKAA